MAILRAFFCTLALIFGLNVWALPDPAHYTVIPVATATGIFAKLSGGKCVVRIEKRKDSSALVTLMVVNGEVPENLEQGNLRDLDENIELNRSEEIASGHWPFRAEAPWKSERVEKYEGGELLLRTTFNESTFSMVELSKSEDDSGWEYRFTYSIFTNHDLSKVSGAVIEFAENLGLDEKPRAEQEGDGKIICSDLMS